MAEGFLRKYVDKNISVFSAGIEAHGVNPLAVKAMNEIGIDISTHKSNTIEELPDFVFKYVLTVCDNAKEKCPYFPATSSVIHHNFPDPAQAKGSQEEIMTAFRNTRELIKEFCQELSKKLN